MANIEDVAHALGVPTWWAEAIAVEYLPCRRFGGAPEVWQFDFNLITNDQLASAVERFNVVFFGVVFHNVRRDVLAHRMFSRMFTMPAAPVPLPLHADDIRPEGQIGPHSFPHLANPIAVWDPKLDFSWNVQVRDDEGLWQWEVARFEAVSGQVAGEWISDVIDTSRLGDVPPRLAELRNPPGRKVPGESGHDEFVEQLRTLYDWVEDIRRPIREDAWRYHQQRKASPFRNTAVSVEPPLLCQFEDFTIEDGTLRTRLHGEPLFFQACVRNARRGAATTESADGPLDDLISARVQAVINAAACLEAFANSVGQEMIPQWRLYEKLTIEGKWHLCFATVGKAELFDPSVEPFQTLGKIVELRNRWMHYGRPFERVRVANQGTLTWIEARMGAEFVEALPVRIRELVGSLSIAVGRAIPGWLEEAEGWRF